jgi:hypothetical protein
MARAREMVAAYAAAGFTKIHLDASMACGGEALSEAEMATRAADLCAVAEATRPGVLHYVIGTEVPVPGGETAHRDHLAVTAPAAARRTHALHRAAFAARGPDAAFARVIGVVVQPGVDFGNAQVMAYDRARAAALAAAAPGLDGPALRGAFHRLPVRGRPECAGAGPLRHPQGRSGTDLCLPSGRAGAGTAGKPDGAAALGGEPRPSGGHAGAPRRLARPADWRAPPTGAPMCRRGRRRSG